MYAGGGSNALTHGSASGFTNGGNSAVGGGGGGGGGSGATTSSGSTFSNALAEANDLDALVFDFGTSKCKLGFAGEDAPRVYESILGDFAVDNASERERAAQMEMDAEQIAQWLFDATASSPFQTRLSDHPLLYVERPFPIPDEIANDAAAKSVGVGGNGSTSQTDKSGNSTSTTPAKSTPLSTKKREVKTRERMVEVLMEQLGVPALFCSKSAVLTCYANARTSGLVVDMGATYTSVTSVQEGYALSYPKSQVAVFGGYDLDAFLWDKLEKQIEQNRAALASATVTTPDQEIAKRTPKVWSCAIEAKESGLCRVADGAFDEAQNAQLPMINYELPDKTIVAMGTERFSVAEQYFIQSTNSLPSPQVHGGINSGTKPMEVVQEFDGNRRPLKRGISLPEMICEAGGMTTEAELRKELFQNIVLTGGSSCFDNMPNRLEREVANAISSYQLLSASNGTTLGGNLRVKITAAHPQERKLGAFLGGSILASLGSFHEMWMSKAEYAEHGAELIHKKCP